MRGLGLKYYTVLENTIAFANYGLNQFKESRDLNETTITVVSSLLRKIIELSDGVYVSALNGLKGPAEINYRGVIEAYLAFRYINQNEEERSNRAIAYKIGYHKIQINHVESLGNRSINNSDLSLFQNQLNYHRAELEKEEFRDVLREYNNLQSRTHGGYIPKWYSLYEGPKSINQLAKHIEENMNNSDDKKIIVTLYGALSSKAHNLLALSDVGMSETGEITLKSVRSPFNSNVDSYNLSAVIYLLNAALNHLTQNFYPEFIGEFIEFDDYIKDALAI